MCLRNLKALTIARAFEFELVRISAKDPTPTLEAAVGTGMFAEDRAWERIAQGQMLGGYRKGRPAKEKEQ